MNATEMLEKLGESLGSTATVKSVFGEPIHAEGKTVVPVAKVAYGFGGGGRGNGGSREQEGGGGGGMRAFPAGALEITPTQTRFIPYNDVRWMAGAFAAGALLSRLLFRRK
jgi:uncharacterized spore protein YtfJ